MIIKHNLEQIIKGEYVATPIQNAFNDKTAYWLSKRGCTVSIYVFTVEECLDLEDLKKRLSEEGMRPYVRMLEEHFLS